MDGQPWKELGSNRRSRPPRPGGISLANPRSSPSSNAGAKTPHGQEHRLTPSRDSSPLWAYKDRFLREFDPQANLAIYRQSTKPPRYRRQCSTAPPFWSHDASPRTNFRYQAAQFVGRSLARANLSPEDVRRGLCLDEPVGHIKRSTTLTGLLDLTDALVNQEDRSARWLVAVSVFIPRRSGLGVPRYCR